MTKPASPAKPSEELSDKELNRVVGGIDSAKMTIKVSPEYSRWKTASG